MNETMLRLKENKAEKQNAKTLHHIFKHTAIIISYHLTTSQPSLFRLLQRRKINRASIGVRLVVATGVSFLTHSHSLVDFESFDTNSSDGVALAAYCMNVRVTLPLCWYYHAGVLASVLDSRYRYIGRGSIEKEDD